MSEKTSQKKTNHQKHFFSGESFSFIPGDPWDAKKKNRVFFIFKHSPRVDPKVSPGDPRGIPPGEKATNNTVAKRLA